MEVFMKKHLTLAVACMLLAAGAWPILAQDISASSQTGKSVEEQADETDNLATHPIDREINELLDKNLNTYAQVEAITHGTELWDAELNRVYKELRNAYGENEKAKTELKTAQLAWIKFRDAEYEHFSAMYQLKDGTMYRIYHVSDRLEVVKARALQLKSRLDILNDDK